MVLDAGNIRQWFDAIVDGSQVKRGLYRGAEGQWRAYREALAPVMPVLEPWVKAFGYPAD